MPPQDIEAGIILLGRIPAEGDLPGPDAHPVADAFHGNEVGRAESRVEPLRQSLHLHVLDADGAGEDAEGFRSVLSLEVEEPG